MRFAIRAAVAVAAVLFLAGCSGNGLARTKTKPEPLYDPKTGLLRILKVDLNNNGTNESTAHMDGARVVSVELDLDEDGKIERWDFYTPERELEKIGFSRANDGVMDALTFYNADKTIHRIEISTQRDGRYDKIEYYEKNVLVRSEEDANGDGKIDQWQTWAARSDAAPGEPAYHVTSAAFDDTGTGKPQRRFIYGPSGAIARVEVDPDGDGVFTALRQDTGQVNAARASADATRAGTR